MPFSSSNKTSLINEADEDLLVIISMEDVGDERELAFNEFHRRYAPFTWNYISQIGRYSLSDEECRDIFNRTFVNVFNYSGSFDTQGETDPAIIRKKIRGWLARIVKTEVKNYLTEGRYIPQQAIDNYQKMIESSLNKSVTTYPKQILQEALAQLSERDQHVFLTYWQFYEPGQASQARNLPKDVLDELGQRYQTSKANIRQIIHRSFEKVTAYINMNYSTYQTKSHGKRT